MNADIAAVHPAAIRRFLHHVAKPIMVRAMTVPDRGYKNHGTEVGCITLFDDVSYRAMLRPGVRSPSTELCG